MTIESRNPATGEVVATYEAHSEQHVESAVQRAKTSFHPWSRASFHTRSEMLMRSATILEENAGEFAELMALEMGKPVREGRSEAEKCASVCRYYAENAESQLTPKTIETDNTESGYVMRPLGAVLAVMPWNFPFWQVFRAAAPTLMAGNTMLLKHASNVTGCALAIETVFRESGADPGLFQTLVVPSNRIGALIEHEAVRAVTLTGSTEAGRAVGAAAGEHIKPCVLELGGSDPYVILEDADLDLAADKCAQSRLINSGQSCIAAKRFIVVEPVREAFTEKLIARMSDQIVGDPLASSTTIGPQARLDLRDDLHEQVKQSIAAGARCELGGAIPGRDGAFYDPTVLSNVSDGMPAYSEELFGPVAAVISAKDEVDAIRIANDTSFGLGAAVFTKDVERGKRVARDELDAGCCAVNDFVRSNPHLPFGGIKNSGVGRELGALGIRSFVNVKTVVVG